MFTNLKIIFTACLPEFTKSGRGLGEFFPKIANMEAGSEQKPTSGNLAKTYSRCVLLRSRSGTNSRSSSKSKNLLCIHASNRRCSLQILRIRKA